MVNKFKTATKRIAAVAASVAMVSATAFAGGLTNYPNNFVKNGVFDGQVIVGATAQAIDTTSAQSIIDNLASQFSGNTSKTIITATKTTGAGQSISIDDPGSSLNYGEDFNSVRRSSFDDTDLKILADGTFNNGADDEDYTQEIKLADNGYFEHSLRDDFESSIDDHIYLDNKGVANYTLEFKTPVDYSSDKTQSDLNRDFVGKTLTIMGRDFTITGVGTNFSYIEMMGGANQVTLGEGDAPITVTDNGKDYKVSVISVSSGSNSNEVLVNINGQTKSIDEYDSDTVDGVEVGVTDAFPSSRDSVKGYATLIVGGNKIRLEGNGDEVKINDKTISDAYDNYVVDSWINRSDYKLNYIKLAYKLDDDRILQAGQSWKDRVFNAFSLQYKGTNNPTYDDIKVKEDSDKLSIQGKTIDGNNYNEDVAKIVDDTNANSYIHLIGHNDDDSFIVDNLNPHPVVDNKTGVVDANKIGVVFDIISSDGSKATISANGVNLGAINEGATFVANDYLFNLTDAGNGTDNKSTIDLLGVSLVDANGFETLVGDKDNQELYEFKTYTPSSNEIDVDNILNGDSRSDIAEKDIGQGKLTDLTSTDTTEDGVLTNIGGTYDSLAFADNMMLNLSAVNGIAGTSRLKFWLDKQDLTADDEPRDFGHGFNVTLAVDTTNNEFDVKLPSNQADFVTYPSGAKADVTDENSDVQEFVTKYGVKVTYDNQDKTYVDVAVPDKQVAADVELVSGTPQVETKTYTVDSSEVAAKVAELKADGYTVTTAPAPATNVEFDIKAPVFDNQVTTVKNAIVVGGPAVNSAARKLMGITDYTIDKAGVAPGEGIAKYYADSNSLLVYGYSGQDTQAIVEKLNAGTANIQ